MGLGRSYMKIATLRNDAGATYNLYASSTSPPVFTPEHTGDVALSSGGIWIWSGAAWASSGGGGAPTNASYVVVSLDGTLTNDRRLQGTTDLITLTDNGAGADLVINVGSNVYRVGGTDVAVADGGTGASTPEGARTNLGTRAEAMMIQAFGAF